MSVKIIADPGSCWRATPEELLWRGKLRFRRLIEATAASGANTFKPQYLRRTVYPEGSAESELVAGYEWPPEWIPWMKEECEIRGLEFGCTIYEPEHVPIIDPYVPFFKISSFEAQRPDLLQAVAATGKPLIISTGMANWEDAIAAVRTVVGIDWVCATYLHCASAYPARPEQMNLLAMPHPNRLGEWGLSDHTIRTTAAVMAVALGATVIESHIRTKDVLTGPDAHFARDPDQFTQYVNAIREAETMRGDGIKKPQEGEWTWAKWQVETGKRGTQSSQSEAKGIS